MWESQQQQQLFQLQSTSGNQLFPRLFPQEASARFRSFPQKASAWLFNKKLHSSNTFFLSRVFVEWSFLWKTSHFQDENLDMSSQQFSVFFSTKSFWSTQIYPQKAPLLQYFFLGIGCWQSRASCGKLHSSKTGKLDFFNSTVFCIFFHKTFRSSKTQLFFSLLSAFVTKKMSLFLCASEPVFPMNVSVGRWGWGPKSWGCLCCHGPSPVYWT